MDKKGSPIFMKMKEQGHGFIRKNKAGKVVSGIILGATMFMAGQVASADEVKPNPEVSNISELLKKPDNTNDAVKKGNPDVAEKIVAKKDTAVVPAKEEVKSPEQAKVDGQLNKIASDAKAKGVDVTFKGEVTVAPEKTDEALKNVEGKVNKVVAEHTKEVEAYNKKLAEVRAENDKIRKENTATENSNKNAKAVLTKDSTAKEANGAYTQTLVGKSNTNHTEDKKVNHKPMDLVALIDFSSSFQSKRTQALNTLKTLIQTNLTDEDGVMLQGYIFNKPESYSAHGSQLNFAKLRNADWETGFSTKLLSKKDALSVIDKWASVGAPGSANGTATFTAYFNEIAGAMGDFGYKTDEKDGDGFVKKFPFEDVYSSQPNKKKLVSVVQFTDGWAESEAMDATFANWAKDNAKTFMTIVNRNNLSTDDNNDTYSIESMKKLGHPNIYDMTGKKDDVVLKEVLEQFKNTATEVNTTVQNAKSKGVITLTPNENVTLVSATLISPSGKKQALEVKNNKVSYTGELTEKGDYKVEYHFKSNKNEKGQVVGTFTVDSDIQDSTTKDKKVNAPMDLIAMVDESPSNSSRSSAIFPILKKMMADANPKSRMAFYGTTVNEINSHIVRKGSATRWLSMEEANKFIDIIINKMNQREREGWQDKYANNWFVDAIKENPQFAVEEKYYNKEIEQTHKDLPNKNKVFNIIQVTDGWSPNEVMDRSFAEYAKANAKTFVSVIDAPASADYATGQMKQYGLDNAVNLSPVDDIDKIVAYFKQVAVETEVVKGTPKKSSTKDSKTDKFEPISAKVGKSLLAEPKAPANAKVEVEKLKVVKPELKKGSIVQVFVDEGGKEIAPKTNTGEKPVDETVKLTHPNEITFEGKTYIFTKQDKADLTKIPNGTETITYTYKLKEEPKPAPTPKPEVCPAPEPVKDKPVLPKTGTEASMSLMLLGIGGLTLAGSMLKKKEEK